MEISDLKAFMSVIRTGSLGGAAAVLNQTPSATSKAVRRLEKSLGHRLFDRRGQRLHLNLAAGVGHPLAKGACDAVVQASLAEVLQYEFACPTETHLGGIRSLSHTDGWRDDHLPRRVRFRFDDQQLLLDIVKQGTALAYMPDYLLRRAGLVHVLATDCPYSCSDSVWIVWAPGGAGWYDQFIDALLRRVSKAKT